jgi:hypothetical protein
LKGINPGLTEHDSEGQDYGREYAYEEDEEPTEGQYPKKKDMDEVSCGTANEKVSFEVAFPKTDDDEKIKRADTIITFEEWCPENETKVREDTCSVKLDKDKSFLDLDVVNVQNNDCYKNHLKTEYDNDIIYNLKSKHHGLFGDKVLATNAAESCSDVKHSRMLKIIAIFFWVVAIACLISAACLFGGSAARGSKIKLTGIIGSYNNDNDEDPSDVGRTTYDINGNNK